MIHRFVFLYLIFSNLLFGQVNDNFSDGNFTKNPTWIGDTTLFSVGGDSLQSNSTILNSNFYISTASNRVKNTQWELSLRLAFSTSSANYVDVFLASDSSNLTKTQNGYFIRVGNTKDEVSLYKIKGGITTLLIDGQDNTVSSSDNNLRLKVIHDNNGLWSLKHELNGNGNNYISETPASDTSIVTSSNFGFLIKQSTASFFKKHWFDDIVVGDIVVDKTPPKLVNALVADSNNLTLFFSENISILTAQNILNYSVNNSIGNPITATLDGITNSIVHLSFSKNIINGLENIIAINNLTDEALNTINTNTQTTFYTPQLFDVVFNEIMADPTPSVGLPAVEYLELYNRSNYTVNLQSVLLTIGTSTKALPNYPILPKGYVILINSADSSNYASIKNVIALTGLTVSSLTNSGTTLTLKNTFSDLLHQVSYTDQWYGSTYKASGGWSLEQIDPNNTCGGKNNWKASESTLGGTPGKTNSVNAQNPDSDNPELLRALIVDSNKLRLFLSERINPLTVKITDNYSVNNLIGKPINIAITGADATDILLTYAKNFLDKTIYTITVKNSITDCVGNNLMAESNIDFAIPEKADTNDVLINEILYNPQTDGVDFVEIYNNSDKIIDLNSLRISSIDTSTLKLTSIYEIDTIGYLIFPHSYYVLTENPSDIKKRYTVPNAKNFVAVQNLPTLSITSGSFAISKTNLRLIDYAFYSDNMQFPLLASSKGVSLERISFTNKTTDKGNWHSASETSGFATPTAKNSQFINDKISDNFITLSNEIFSPDNDGYEDVLQITLNEKAQGSVSSISVYNQRGVFIKQLANNLLLGTDNNIVTWDGTNATNEKTDMGIYILIVSTFDINGNTNQYKKAVVVAGKL